MKLYQLINLRAYIILVTYTACGKFQISPNGICGKLRNFFTSGMYGMWRMYILCCFVVKSILSRFAFFVKKIQFAAICALLCGEK